MSALPIAVTALRRAGRRLRPLARLPGARGGSAAIEFALIGTIFAVLLLNVVDFALLLWSQMQVDFAAQAGAQAAYNICAPRNTPAATNCPTLNEVVTAAAQSTSLGSAVTLADGSPAERYFCTSGTSLQPPGGLASPPTPFNCSSFGNPSITPGDYVSVSVTYTYQPLFAGLSLVKRHSLQATGMQRLH